MANPFVKGWKYLMALFGAKIDEHADPKIQIQQAIEESQRQHQTLVGQAAAVIGNQRQLEMKLSRTMSEVEKLQSSARQALVLAEKAHADGDQKKATEYEQSAQAFAAQLVSAEQSMEDLKTLHDQAINAAEQARQAVENNSMMLQQKLAERTKLLSQLEQAKMQETIASSLESMSSLAAPRQRAQHGRGSRQDRTPLLDRDGTSGLGQQLGRRPDDGSAEVHGRHGGFVPAGADPGKPARREARWSVDRCRCGVGKFVQLLRPRLGFTT